MVHVHDELKTDSLHQQSHVTGQNCWLVWAGETPHLNKYYCLQLFLWSPAHELEDSPITWHSGKSSFIPIRTACTFAAKPKCSPVVSRHVVQPLISVAYCRDLSAVYTLLVPHSDIPRLNIHLIWRWILSIAVFNLNNCAYNFLQSNSVSCAVLCHLSYPEYLTNSVSHRSVTDCALLS